MLETCINSGNNQRIQRRQIYRRYAFGNFVKQSLYRMCRTIHKIVVRVVLVTRFDKIRCKHTTLVRNSKRNYSNHSRCSLSMPVAKYGKSRQTSRKAWDNMMTGPRLVLVARRIKLNTFTCKWFVRSLHNNVNLEIHKSGVNGQIVAAKGGEVIEETAIKLFSLPLFFKYPLN